MQLTTDRLLYWPAQEAILLADLHLGKATHFRKNGVYVPGDVLADELARLTKAIINHKARQVFFLGDLFHAKYNEEWPRFTNWMKQFQSMQWHLVKGNHDVLGEATYLSAGFEVHKQSLMLDGICLAHKPEDLPDDVVGVAGHIHPGFVLTAKRMVGGVKLPCLWRSTHKWILPAWGAFTGLDIITPAKQDELYLIGKDQIWPLQFT